jgi:hypothetical protein
VGFGPGSPHADLSHQGQDVPEIAGLEAGVLHHLQQQVGRGLGVAVWFWRAVAMASPASARLHAGAADRKGGQTRILKDPL